MPSSKLFPHLPTSRKHSSLVLWSGSVGDVSEIPRRLTEALVAELSVCVAFGWSLYEIFSVQKFHQSRRLAKTKLHPEYPHIKQMNPALKQEISVFCEPEHPKNMQLLDKIHTVFTAALRNWQLRSSASNFLKNKKLTIRTGTQFRGGNKNKNAPLRCKLRLRIRTNHTVVVQRGGVQHSTNSVPPTFQVEFRLLTS